MHKTHVQAPTPAGRTTIFSRSLRLGNSLRLAAILLMMMVGAQNVWGQTYYVFYNSNVGYILNNGGSIEVSGNSDFSPSSVWIASGTLQNSNNNLRTIRSYTDNTQYMVGNGNGSQMSLGNSQQSWRINSGYLYHRNYYYVISASGTLYTYNSTSYDRFTPTAISTPSTSSVVTVTASISGDDAISSPGNYTYTGNTGTTTVSYTLFTISGNNHYWYNDEDHDSAPAQSNQSWGTITKTWSLSGADGYATVNGSTGVVTVTNVPLIPKTITLTLTVEDGTHSLTIKKYIMLSTTPSSSSGSGGTVTLNDLEDHNWTYYSGIDASVDNGNYNNNYAGKMYSPNPRNVKITYNGVNSVNGSSTTVQVSITESENQFIYYKTLEQGSTSGEYPYQVISNPFSVRPSTGTGNSKKYYGFAGWKIVSGGEYIKNHNNDDVLSLDEQIVFNNLPYSSVNCTSAEIVFETTWTQATVVNGNSISLTNLSSSGTYETNFYVLTGTYTTAWTGSKNVTVTSVYPDGSSDTRSNNNYTRLNVTVSSGYTVKYEYININDNTTTLSLGTGTKTLYIGRGVSNTTANGVVCNLIQGCNTSINNGGLTYTLKIESGIYNYLSFTSGYEGSSQTNTIKGTVSMKSILGCDYDRAKGDNSKLKIQKQIMLGYTSDGTQVLQSPAAGEEVLNVTLKSGSLNSSLTSAGTADAKQSFYIGIGGEYSPGARVFTMEGGEMWNLAAGLCKNTATTNSVRFRIKGGLVKGSIYGSAANANSYGYKQMIITGGQIKGWIAGGGNGTSNNGGTTTGSSYIYVGGNARVDSEGRITRINSSLGGQVFGSGSGVDGSTTWGEMLYGTNVVIADNAYIERNVFGGGNFGWTDQTANIYLTGKSMSVGNVYGGANQNKGEYVNIYMTGGTVREGLYGGSNTTGTISNDVKMVINGGQVGSSSSNANIHGGGYGSSTIVTGNVDITLGTQNQNTPGVTVYGDVYGGSALGKVNGTDTSTSKHTNVTLNKGTINGSLYGGALGDNSTAANVYAPVTVTVNGGKADNVYGCNNVNGKPQSTVSVTINGTDAVESGNAIGRVFGGGNQAAYSGTPDVDMKGGIVGTIFGGGNEAGVSGGDVAMTGGKVTTGIYGGCNTSGTVSGAIVVNINGGQVGTSTTSANIHGGGYGANTGTSGNVDVTIGSAVGAQTYATIYGDVYGGSALGKVNGTSVQTSLHTNVTLNAGKIHGSLYGGALGDQNTAANVYAPVHVEVNGGTVTGQVYGCNNVKGAPQSTVNVDINGTDTPESGYALAEVYGGGNKAAYTGTPVVAVHNCDNSIGYVYGGGNATDVYGTDITIWGGNTIGYVFGGGNGDGEGNPGANVGNGGTSVKIRGGTIDHIFGGGNMKGSITGAISVNINKDTETGHSGCQMHIGEVYGGGNEAPSAAGSISIGCTGLQSNNEGINYVYGGANKANVTGDISLSITGGRINNLFGGNNDSGTIDGDITIDVAWNGQCDEYLGNVYGGGNLATYSQKTDGHPAVNIKNATVSGSVYGGGKGDPANSAKGVVTGNPVVIIGTTNASQYVVVTGNVYGGGDAAGVTGNTSVTYNDNNSNSSVAKLFGGGNAANVSGTTSVTLTNGKVTGGIYGGCNATGSVGAVTITLYGGQVGATGNAADVYGGGYGAPTTTTGNIGVTLNGTTVYGDIYGGSALGKVNASTSNTTTLDIKTNSLHGCIYGGGMGDNSTKAESNGNVIVNYDYANSNLTGIYGGANVQGVVKGNISVNINANVGAQSANIDIFGGGLGQKTDTEGNVTVTIGNMAGSITPLIYGDIYGGSALGNVNNQPSDVTTVNFLNGTLHGNIYGGGLGDKASLNSGNDNSHSDVEAKVHGKVVVNIGDNSQTTAQCKIDLRDARIYGCNNTNGSPQDDVEVHIYKTAYNFSDYATGDKYKHTYTTAVNNVAPAYAIKEAFGGGNQANYAPENNDPDSEKKAKLYVHGCTNTIERVFGGGNAAAAVGLVTTIDGGRFDYVFGGGNGEDKAANIGLGGTNLTVHGGSVNKLFGGSNEQGTISGTMGVSVDASGDCSSDMYIAEFFCGNNLANIGTAENPVNINATIGCDTKFGDVYGGCNLADIVGNVTLTVVGGEMNRVFGGSKGRLADNTDPNNPIAAKAANIDGDVTLNITGGNIGSAFGGSNINGNITGSIEVNVEKAANPCVWQIGDVYGASNDAAYTPSKDGNTLKVNIKNGTIGGSVFGGGKGPTATATSNPQVTIGDATEGYTAVITGDVYGGGDAAAVVGTPVVRIINKSTTSIGNVYGGGNAADVSATSVTIDGGTITGDVFGGGHGDKAILNVGNETGHSDKVANVNGNVSVTVTGGTINRVFGGSNTNGSISGTVTVNVNKGANSGDLHITELYGGGNLANGKAGTITIGCTGGASEGIGDVYGGANQADIGTAQNASNISLSITGGKIGRVFGGNNTSGTIYGTIQVDIDWATGNDACGVNSLGSVFGGGNQASYSAPTGSTNYPVVNIKNGTITNNVFGGGLGATAVVTGNPQVTIGDATRLNNDAIVAVVSGDVYGGGDAAAVVGVPVVRVINKCNTSIGNVYGGGNAADVSATSVTIDGGTITGDVYGGGHGDKAILNVGNETGHSDKVANVNGNVSVTVTGGTIHRVFGGSNTNGNITGTVAVNVNKGANSCDLNITELYGGGNMAAGNAGTITIGCTGGANEGIGDVYGGANQADIGSSSQASNISLSITGGKIGRVFGGNNTSGTIYGTIQVDVEWATGNDACGVNSLGSVFGGGNQASYSAPSGSTNYPVVNIKNGTITNNVFGGGLGASATVTGNPQVTIGDATEGYAAVITGDVYGGGDAASVSGTPMVRVINKSNTSIANVYGGGNAADVSATSVTIDGGTITGDVFGGGHGDKALLGEGHQDKTANVGGNVSVSITGGTIHRVFGGSNTNGNISGTVAVNVNKGDTSGEMHIDELYGGGNVAAGNAGNITIGCTGGATEGIGDVYGGANAADVNNGIALTITGGHINRVFGGNNTSGSISGSIQVNVNWNANSTCGDNYIGNVYGGGNQAPYTYNGNYPEVNITNGEITHNVYGGGLGAGATVTANPQVVLTGGTITGNVFGGGEAAPVTGNPTVTANGATATRLYGGGLGSTAIVTGNTTVTVNNGTFDYVFGGGEAANQAGSVIVNIKGGTINEDVYGGGALANTNTGNLNGNAITSTTANTTTVNLTGGTMKNVYGGGLGDTDTEAIVYGNVLVNLNKGVADNAKGASISDHLFGCNNINGTPKGSATVHVYATQNSGLGSILTKNNSSYDMQAVYGGGNMAAYIPASDTASTHVIIDGCGKTSIEYVYGGGNAAPVPATNVLVYGTYKVYSVFGGGNGKDQITVNGVLTDNPGADVGIYKVSETVYNNTDPSLQYQDPGHEKGDDKYILYGSTAGSSIIGTTNVIFYGGNVTHLFGGSNTKGDIVKESKVILGDENLQTCVFNVDDVYGGSNEAYMSGTSAIDMNCIDGMGEVYGGSRMADVHQDVVLTISGGHYSKVFGGNNISGRIFGSITVNIEQTGCLPIVIDELYGGGNQAPYSVFGYDGNTIREDGERQYADPVINIISCDTIRKVFGGGYGEGALVVGNPHININMIKGWTNGDYRGNGKQNDPHKAYIGTRKVSDNIGVIDTVFGGGNAARVKGETYVNIGTESNVTVRNVSKAVYNALVAAEVTDITPGFTQSEGEAVTKDLTFKVEGANITGNVYGGGNHADVTGGTHVNVGKE